MGIFAAWSLCFSRKISLVSSEKNQKQPANPATSLLYFDLKPQTPLKGIFYFCNALIINKERTNSCLLKILALLPVFDSKYFLVARSSNACFGTSQHFFTASSFGFCGWLAPSLRLRCSCAKTAPHTYRYLLCIFLFGLLMCLCGEQDAGCLRVSFHKQFRTFLHLLETCAWLLHIMKEKRTQAGKRKKEKYKKSGIKRFWLVVSNDNNNHPQYIVISFSFKEAWKRCLFQTSTLLCLFQICRTKLPLAFSLFSPMRRTLQSKRAQLAMMGLQSELAASE